MNSTARSGIWICVAIDLVLLVIFLFYAPTAANFPYSYTLSNPPGTLVSQRWSFDFVVVALFSFLIFFPFILLFAADGGGRWRLILFYVLAGLFLAWFLATFIKGCIDWGAANGTAPGNYFNRANDARWCCVYYNLPGAPCGNHIACTPSVSANALAVDGTYLYQIWMNFIMCILLVVQIILAACLIKPEREEEDSPPAIKAPLIGPKTIKKNRYNYVSVPLSVPLSLINKQE